MALKVTKKSFCGGQTLAKQHPIEVDVIHKVITITAFASRN